MNTCRPIKGLRFDAVSRTALKQIRDYRRIGALLSKILTVGVFSNIFTKSNSLTASYNINQTDWVQYFEAMKSIPKITRKAIEKEIGFMVLHYMQPENTNDKLMTFWRNLDDGCK